MHINTKQVAAGLIRTNSNINNQAILKIKIIEKQHNNKHIKIFKIGSYSERPPRIDTVI
jgi:hypothetical protein